MQWDATAPHGGFTSSSATPWMRANPSHASGVNAADQAADPASVFHCWRAVLAARRRLAGALVYGAFELLPGDEADERVFAYLRASSAAGGRGERVAVVCNFSADAVVWEGLPGRVCEVVLSTTEKGVDDFEGGRVQLSPYEAVAVLC